MNMTTRLIIICGLAILFGGAIVLKETRERGGTGNDEVEAPGTDSRLEAVKLNDMLDAPSVADPSETTASFPRVDPAALPRLIDLGSDQCVPCKLMAPILEELKRDYVKAFAVEFIDARKNPPVAALYGIRVIPTQIFLDADGDELFRHEGFMSKEAILAKWLELGVDIRRRALPTAM